MKDQANLLFPYTMFIYIFFILKGCCQNYIFKNYFLLKRTNFIQLILNLLKLFHKHTNLFYYKTHKSVNFN